MVSSELPTSRPARAVEVNDDLLSADVAFWNDARAEGAEGFVHVGTAACGTATTAKAVKTRMISMVHILAEKSGHHVFAFSRGLEGVGGRKAECAKIMFREEIIFQCS